MTTRILASFLCFAAASLSGLAREHRVELSPEAAAGRLEISGLSGDIKIEGSDEPALVIQTDSDEPEEDAPPAEPPAGLRSLLSSGSDNSGLGLQIETNGNRTTIVSVRPDDDDDFVFQVPRAISVRLAGLIRGDVVAHGLTSEVEINANEGDIALDDVLGPLVVQSVNGDVHVVFTSITGERPSSINAVNGRVVVELPPDSKVSLELHTINGDIFTDLPVEVKERRVTVMGGPRAVTATLNGGGTPLKINSINEGVIVRSRAAPPPK